MNSLSAVSITVSFIFFYLNKAYVSSIEMLFNHFIATILDDVTFFVNTIAMNEIHITFVYFYKFYFHPVLHYFFFTFQQPPCTIVKK
jgi:hypothetical protein